MKAFVYTKKESKLTFTFDKVVSVQQLNATIVMVNESGEIFTVDTKQYKTTIYQN